jgi:hypothetical protein
MLEEGKKRGLEFRPHDMLWSAAIGPNFGKCIKALSALYDRALRSHPRTVAVATETSSTILFPLCETTVLLADSKREPINSAFPRGRAKFQIPLRSGDVWTQLLDIALGKKHKDMESS